VTDVYGVNSDQVEMLLGRLRELPAEQWRALQEAHEASPTLDPAEEALAAVLAREGLRDHWFELREQAHEMARVAAAEYAAESGEEERTIEHVSAVNAWDGQREKSKLEVLGPVHERGFVDAACGALGVALSRPYIGERDFDRFWAAYQPVLGRLAVEG